METEKNRLQHTLEADFHQIMREYGTKVHRLVFLFVKDRNLAEDITQEVFIKVYRYLGGFRKESSIQTWVYKIAVNESKRYMRTWSFRNIFTRSRLQEGILPSVESEALSKIDRENIAELVVKLIPAYRQVIALHYYADLSISEVALTLGQTEGAVRTKLHRARQQLKKLMEQEEL